MSSGKWEQNLRQQYGSDSLKTQRLSSLCCYLWSSSRLDRISLVVSILSIISQKCDKFNELFNHWPGPALAKPSHSPPVTQSLLQRGPFEWQTSWSKVLWNYSDLPSPSGSAECAWGTSAVIQLDFKGSRPCGRFSRDPITLMTSTWDLQVVYFHCLSSFSALVEVVE